MLFLVGIGLTGKDLSIKAIGACKRSELMVDRYTCLVDDDHLNLIKSLSGKSEIRVLVRSDMEEGAKDIVAKAAKGDVAVLIGGDPLMATTHKILFIEAKKRNVEVEIIHSNSVLTAAIGESGLDFYRFGAIATIPKWSAHYTPVSFYEVLRKNLQNNLHTLLLLDYSQELAASLSIKESIGILEKAEESYKSGIIKDDTRIIVLNCLSSERQQKLFTNVAKAKTLELGGPSVIIVPATMTSIENEIVTAMCKTID
jgi:diphthine synthase